MRATESPPAVTGTVVDPLVLGAFGSFASAHGTTSFNPANHERAIEFCRSADDLITGMHGDDPVRVYQELGATDGAGTSRRTDAADDGRMLTNVWKSPECGEPIPLRRRLKLTGGHIHMNNNCLLVVVLMLRGGAA